jgi:hypothetical protein
MQGSRCGIYGANSPEWIITMEVKSCTTGCSILIILQQVTSVGLLVEAITSTMFYMYLLPT